MKNVTITLPDDLAHRARVEAAKAGKSLSRFVADRLARDFQERAADAQTKTAQREALERFLSGPGWPGVSADLPSREELYAERLLHRHEPPALREGQADTDKGGQDHQGPRRPRRS